MDNRTRNLMMGAAGVESKTYIEDVFSTYLYTGNGSSQTINNGIDLSGKGGMVWIKGRSDLSPSTGYNVLVDTTRGVYNTLFTNTTGAEINQTNTVTAFNGTGFSLGNYQPCNQSGSNFASWTFRKAAKFFDVVTYTGALANLDVSHNLGTTPGCIIIKQTNGASNWFVWHRSTTDIYLNLTNAASGFQNEVGNITSSSFRVFYGASNTNLNASATYVAYLFAHDTTADGMIQCGSVTGTGGTDAVSLGWEPQWLLIKSSNGIGNWLLVDNMRGLPGTSTANTARIFANSSNAESSSTGEVTLNQTGFQGNGNFNSGTTYIYIAIRRGPMKTPTSGASVFSVASRTGTGSITKTTATPDVVDWFYTRYLTSGGVNPKGFTRLTGAANALDSTTTGAERSDTGQLNSFAAMNGVILEADTSGFTNFSGARYSDFYFRRAPGFFDVVAYTGTGSSRTVSHNLGVAPELIIVKGRNQTPNWFVYASIIGSSNYLMLNQTNGSGAASTLWNSTNPTASAFSLGTNTNVNDAAGTYIAYLFASCPGVSKIGSYTGTGTTLQINCGFTNGARFVLIKRTDSTGDWYVWDTARGIVAANDPYILLNSTAAEVTNTDYIDPYAAGFEISSTAPAAINALNGSYIYLAIA